MFLLFDIGGTKTRLSISRDGNNFIPPEIYDTPSDFDAGINLIANYLKKQDIGIQKVGGAIAGVFNKTKEMLIYSPNLPDWIGKNLRRALVNVAGTENIILENDAALNGLGEAVYGAGKDYKIIAYITISTGVGGARIVNKKIDTAVFGFEPGHQLIKVCNSICSDDLNCSSGEELDYLESFISGASFKKRYGENPSEIKSEKIWDRIYHYLAIGLNNVMVFWSPEVIVLGGGVVSSDDFSLERAAMHLEKIMKVYPELPVFRKSSLGDFAGLYGALNLLQNY